MSGKEYIQPKELFDGQSFGFSQVVTSPPGKLVFVSGQVAYNSKFELVGESDLKLQAEQALKNVSYALKAAGASHSDVTMMRANIVNLKPEHGEILSGPISDFFGDNPPSASTWVGVTSLAAEGILIEIEAIAVISN